MLDKLQVFFQENDAENEVLRSVTSLTKKVGKWEQNLRTKKYHWLFHVIFVRMNVNLSKSSLSFFLSKTEIRLRYRKISTMMFLSIKKVFYTPQNNYGNTTVRVLGFAEILTIF